MVTLTGFVLTPLTLAVTYLTNSVTPIITSIVNLNTPVTSALGSVVGDYLSLLATVTTSINALLAQLGIAATGGTPNIEVTIKTVTSSLIAGLVQLLQRASSSVSSLLVTGTTLVLVQAAYALIIAQVSIINLVAQVAGQAAAILASLFPTVSTTLSQVATYLGSSLSALINIVNSIAQSVQLGSNGLITISPAVNTIVVNLNTAVQPLIGNVAGSVPGPKGGALSAAASVLADAISGVNTLVSAVSGPLGPLGAIVVDSVINVENTLQNIINVLTALAAGTLNAAQATAIFGILLNSVISDLSTILRVIGQSIKTVGDNVANVLKYAVKSVGPLVFDTVRGLANATVAFSSTSDDLIPSVVNQTVTTLTANLQVDLNNINKLVNLIVGGMPTGELAPMVGSAAESSVYLQAADRAFSTFISTVVAREAIDVLNFAAYIVILIKAAFKLS